MPIQFLNPWAGLTSLLAIPIILLYMLRLRRRPVTVPSLLLWEAAARDRHANRPWQKLRRNWLLALQLLALLSLTLALMRPALPTPLAVHGQAILLLDVSASMQGAHPDGGTRFEAAVRELHDVAAALSPADTVTLITVEARPRLWLRGGDARALRQALDEIAPTDGVADWQAAAALAAGSAAGEETTTLLVTDAAISAPIPALPGDVRVLPVGGEQANVGVVAFSLRRHDGGWTAFVRLHNAGPATAREVTLTADGSVVAHRAVDLPAESDIALTFESVPVTAWAEVQLDAAPPTQDALRLDDRAWVAFSAHQAASVLLVTPGNRFLQQALRSLPGTELATTDTLPGGELATSAPGLTVVDGPLTGTLPTSNLWLIAPGAGTPCGEPGAVITPTTARARRLGSSPAALRRLGERPRGARAPLRAARRRRCAHRDRRRPAALGHRTARPAHRVYGLRSPRLGSAAAPRLPHPDLEFGRLADAGRLLHAGDAPPGGRTLDAPPPPRRHGGHVSHARWRIAPHGSRSAAGRCKLKRRRPLPHRGGDRRRDCHALRGAQSVG